MTEDDDIGGMSAALARAEAAVAALARDYLTWARADVELCHQHLTAARAATTTRAQHITDLFGVAHNIKGQGSSFGYPLMTRLGHTLCQLTRLPHNFTDADLDLVAAHLQVMADILQQEARGDGTPELQAAVRKLENDVEAFIAAAGHTGD
jgi:chemotaxis protein histidine kinase CheA